MSVAGSNRLLDAALASRDSKNCSRGYRSGKRFAPLELSASTQFGVRGCLNSDVNVQNDHPRRRAITRYAHRKLDWRPFPEIASAWISNPAALRLVTKTDMGS